MLASITAGLVGGEEFAVDASLIEAHANMGRSILGAEWRKEGDPARSPTRACASMLQLRASGAGFTRACYAQDAQALFGRPRSTRRSRAPD